MLVVKNPVIIYIKRKFKKLLVGFLFLKKILNYQICLFDKIYNPGLIVVILFKLKLFFINTIVI